MYREVRILETRNRRKEMNHEMVIWRKREIESPSVAREIEAMTECVALFIEATEMQPAPALYCGARKGR
jgi:hypothetical protein